MSDFWRTKEMGKMERERECERERDMRRDTDRPLEQNKSLSMHFMEGLALGATTVDTFTLSITHTHTHRTSGSADRRPANPL